LNRRYRNKSGPTDVLSFAQDLANHGHPEVLGDIVISLETVERFCKGDRVAMRAEVRLLFCHGLLHLLGYDHVSDDGRMARVERRLRRRGGLREGLIERGRPS
jgi:probable rRNA maturation factor